MRWRGVELRCPRCRGDLRETGGAEPALRCDACAHDYPVVLGIPDLRVFPDPLLDTAADHAKARKLAAHLDDRDLAGLVALYYEGNDVVTPDQARAFTAGILSAPARAAESLRAWEGAPPGRPAGAMLEIGCGTAPLLVAARGRWEQMVGVDIALRWLVVARKRLADAGMDVPLVCACAEALPFRDASFDRVVGDAVIENVSDQPAALAEAARVLRPGGRIHLATTNRFSIGPDPATGIWAAGWLPAATVAARMRRRGGVPPVRTLLSVPALGALLRRAGFARPRVSLPTFPAEQVASFPPLVRRLVGGYHVAARLPLTRHLLHLVGPKFQVSAERAAR